MTINITKKESKTLARRYKITNIEIEEMIKIKNYDNIIESDEGIKKQWLKFKGQIKENKGNERLSVYWQARKDFIEDYFCLKGAFTS